MNRFEEKFIPEPNTGCWLWTGAVNKNRGYGDFYFQGKTHRAHRISWRLYRGDISFPLCVLHKCDNRLCVNPDHLFLGTVADNQRDAALKNRIAHGANHPHAKLTEDKVRQIRKAVIESPLMHKEIAAQFGISPPELSSIIHFRRWRRVCQ